MFQDLKADFIYLGHELINHLLYGVIMNIGQLGNRCVLKTFPEQNILKRQMETNAKVKICSRVSLTSGVCCTTQNVIQNVQNFNTALCSYVDSKKRLFTSNDEYVFPFVLFVRCGIIITLFIRPSIWPPDLHFQPAFMLIFVYSSNNSSSLQLYW